MAQTARDGDLPYMLDVDSVVRWREEQLAEAGYPPNEAFDLASRLDVDLHVACDLLRRGCAVTVAVAILT